VETGHHVVEGESIKLLVERSASKEEERPPKERLLPTKRQEEKGRGGRGEGWRRERYPSSAQNIGSV